MDIKIDTQKGAEKLKGILNKASDVGKNVVENAQKGTVALVDKVREENYQRRLRKYNPLFPEEYTSNGFALPRLIVVVDESVRRGIDVCEGSVGWCNKEGDADVLYLYSDAINIRKLQFYPSATCDAAYYADSFNSNRYIRVDCIFSKAHEERLAELKNVAYALGAKSCTIEITEANQEVNSSHHTSGINAKARSFGGLVAKSDESTSASRSNLRSGKITAVFEGNDQPKKPKLKWFALDENIKKLIDMRCNSGNALKSETLELSGSTSATMTYKTAASIDGAITKIGIKGSVSMQSQAMIEHSSKLIFSVEF